MASDIANVTHKNGKTVLTDSTTRAKKNSELDKNSFLYILTAELKNQDPTNTQDTTQYVAQMAQFTALEQQQNTNASMTKMLLSQKMTEGSSYIGRDIILQDKDGNPVTETAKSIKMSGGDVYVVTDKGSHSIDEIIGVTGNSKSDVNSDAMNKLLMAEQFTEGLALIGFAATFTDSKGNSINDTVKNVTVEKGVVYAIGQNGKYDMSSLSGVGVKSDSKTAGTTDTTSGAASDSTSNTTAPKDAAAGTNPADNSTGSGSGESSGNTAAGE